MAASDVFDNAEQLLQVGRPEPAIDLLVRYLADAPDTARPLLLLALANERLRRYDEALRCTDRAVAVEPMLMDCWVRRAAALLELKRVDEGIESARRATELAPDNGMTHYVLARALMLKPGNDDEVLAVARTTVGLLPNMAEAHSLLGLVQAQAGDLDAAAEAWRAALAIDPDNVGARNNLAGIDLRKRRAKKAMRGLRAAAANDPQNPVFQENIGRAAFTRLIRHGLLLCLVVLVLVAVVVNVGIPFWLRDVLAAGVVAAWCVLVRLRIGGLASGVRRQLSGLIRTWWGMPMVRGFVFGFGIYQVCALVALAVPATGLVPDLLLGGGFAVGWVSLIGNPLSRRSGADKS